jgi:hypothetical protein
MMLAAQCLGCSLGRNEGAAHLIAMGLLSDAMAETKVTTCLAVSVLPAPDSPLMITVWSSWNWIRCRSPAAATYSHKQRKEGGGG